MMQKCLDANTIYSKISFIFKMRLSQRLNQNIFKTCFIIPEKSFSFWLKAPKKLVITVRNFRIGHLLEIWWSGSKDLFSQIWLSKEVARFQGLFLDKQILWKSSILKRFIFLVSKYANLTGVKTHRDRLKNLRKKTLG